MIIFKKNIFFSFLWVNIFLGNSFYNVYAGKQSGKKTLSRKSYPAMHRTSSQRLILAEGLRQENILPINAKRQRNVPDRFARESALEAARKRAQALSYQKQKDGIRRKNSRVK